MDKQYDELISDRLFFGGAKDASIVVENEAVDMVIDVRQKGLLADEKNKLGYVYKHLPIADEESEIADSIKNVATEIAKAYEEGKNIYFHCGSGSGRAGVAATAILLELGMTDSLEEAKKLVKKARPQVTIRPNMEQALQTLYK